MDNILIQAFALIAVFMAITVVMQRKSEFQTWRNFAKTWLLFGGLATTTVAGYFAVCGASCLNASAGISHIVPGSPADLAGLYVGDRPLVGNKMGDWSSIEAMALDSKAGLLEFSVMRKIDGELREIEVRMVHSDEQTHLRDLGIMLPIEYHPLSATDVALATLHEFSTGQALLARLGLVAEQRYTTLIVDHESAEGNFVGNLSHLMPLLLVGSLLGMAVVSVLQCLKPSWFRDPRYASKVEEAHEESVTCESGAILKAS